MVVFFLFLGYFWGLELSVSPNWKEAIPEAATRMHLSRAASGGSLGGLSTPPVRCEGHSWVGGGGNCVWNIRTNYLPNSADTINMPVLSVHGCYLPCYPASCRTLFRALAPSHLGRDIQRRPCTYVCTYLQLHTPVQCDAGHQPLGAFQQGLQLACCQPGKTSADQSRWSMSRRWRFVSPCVSRIHTDFIHPPSARSFGIPMLRLTCTSIQNIAAVRPICSLDEGIHRLYISFPALPASRFCWPALFVIIFVIQTTASRRPTPTAVLGLGALPPVISFHPSNNQRTRGASPCD